MELCEFKTSLSYRVPGQPGLHRETKQANKGNHEGKVKFLFCFVLFCFVLEREGFEQGNNAADRLFRNITLATTGQGPRD